MTTSSTTAREDLEARVRALEAQAGMRKGVLLATILADRTVAWDAVLAEAGAGGGPVRRGGRNRRWRRAVVLGLLRRRFPRGGYNHNNHHRRPRGEAKPKKAEAAAPLRAAPWFIDVRELAAFCAGDVWARFQATYPVLAVYRAGWVATSPIAEAPAAGSWDTAAWDALWRDDGTVPLPALGAALGWPAALCVAPYLLPLARALYPEEPWDAWTEPGAVRRGAVPALRRTACLLHGFALGGCEPRAVWEAVAMPRRGA